MSDCFYIADSSNSTIRVMTTGFVVTTLAGSPGLSGSTDGVGSAARFAQPYGLSVSPSGDIHAPDLNHRIRKVTPGGVVTTLAGSTSGQADGAGAEAKFYYPRSCAFDYAGNCYVTDCFNNSIRKVAPSGVVTTLAGPTTGYPFAAHGTTDGTGTEARFYKPFGIEYDPVAGCLYVTDESNGSIRKVTLAGVVTTVATGFVSPRGIACDAAGDLYVSDYSDYTLSHVTPAGVVTVIAGLSGEYGHQEGTGSDVRFEYPGGLVVAGDGNIYMVDTGEANIVWRVTPAGVATTVCGTAYVVGSNDGTGPDAQFSNPFDIAIGPAPTPVDPGPATLPVIPNMGGNGVDVLDATWEIDRKGGFTAAALDIVPPKGIAKHETGLLEPVEIRDMLRGGGHLLWEGRIEEPARAARDAERETIECGGYVRYLEDEETFRLNYIDTDIGNWDTTQCTCFADRFDVQVVDDGGVPKLVMKAKEGVEIPDGANARAFYFPFNSAAGVSVTDITFRVTCVNIGAALRLALYTTSGEPGAEKTLIWSRTTDCAALDVSLGPADFPGGAYTLIFRIEQVGGDLTYLVSGTGDPETWGLHYGAEISRIKAYGSTLGTNVTASRVVRDLASTVADDDHRDIETSTLTVGQLLFAEPTTRRAAIEEVNQLLDWDYGMEDGQVFFYRKPWTAATVPDPALVVVSSADPCLSNWDVRLDWEAICNSVMVRYQKANGRFADVLRWDWEGPLGGPTPTRSKFVDLSGSCDDATTAGTIASRILADSLYPQPTGSVTLTGDCHLASGYAMPAIYIRPGMMVKNVDTGEGPLLITHVKGQLVKREIVLTIGTRDNRLSRWMARQEMKARPKAKKRKPK